MINDLQVELAAFERLRLKLVEQHDGKYALLKGTELIDCFTTFEDAYVAGVERFGLEPFLVKEVRKTDPVLHIGQVRAAAFPLGTS
jgi:hypothetical protein